MNVLTTGQLICLFLVHNGDVLHKWGRYHGFFIALKRNHIMRNYLKSFHGHYVFFYYEWHMDHEKMLHYFWRYWFYNKYLEITVNLKPTDRPWLKSDYRIFDVYHHWYVPLFKILEKHKGKLKMDVDYKYIDKSNVKPKKTRKILTWFARFI